jgi:hypothetical protein
MNYYFYFTIIAIGVIALENSSSTELTEFAPITPPVVSSRLQQVLTPARMDLQALHEISADVIPEIVHLLNQSREWTLNNPNAGDYLQAPSMTMLALKLEQHRLELLERNKPLYEQAIESLVTSIDGRSGAHHDHRSPELLKVDDDRVKKALERSKEAEEKGAPRREASWKVFSRLQAANGGFDPDPLPPDFEQQVDAELARMLEAGEVPPYDSSRAGIPSPPKPGAAPMATAGEMVKVIATANNWSPWQWTALGGIIALVGWAAWRRWAKQG